RDPRPSLHALLHHQARRRRARAGARPRSRRCARGPDRLGAGGARHAVRRHAARGRRSPLGRTSCYAAGMTTDLAMLVATALLSLLLPVVYLVGRSSVPGGLAWGFGNRDTLLDVPAWTGRAQRAHANLVENLAPFAILVLVAHVTGRAN